MKSIVLTLKRLIIGIFLLPILFYRFFISPLLGANCRFYPTCSEYGRDAIRLHGVVKGGYLLLHRLLKCHPFGKEGYDPVPLVKTDDSKD